MASLNSFDFTGRLGKDPELRSLDGDKEVCNFTVAVDRFGEKPALWVDVAVWGAGAGPCAKYLSKGSEVAVHGQIDEVRTYRTKAGEPGATLKVSSREVTFIGGKQDDQPRSDVPVTTDDFEPVGAGRPPADDDIPF
jgi:single-strand DNA-binding protein